MIKKLIGAAKKYLLKDTKYFILYSYKYYNNKYRHFANFYNDYGFLEEIKKGRSIIRLGDGEIGLLHYLPIYYQKFSDSIRSDFLKIIKEYNNNSSYILGIPLFVNYTNSELKKCRPGTLRCWMPLKISFQMFFNKNAKYFDQHIFYKDNKFKDILLPYLLSKKIILVTNENNSNEIKNNEFIDNIHKIIICPASDAYENRDKIELDIVDYIQNSNINKDEFAIIMAAGLSKTIIYNLSKKGYQLFDIGKGFEAYYKNFSIEEFI